MMAEWIRSLLDIVLIAMVAVGLYQALRLIRALSGLRQGRVEMERFVHEFNATVVRAEMGIKGLRNAARESGDDLEKLVEKAVMLRDELSFIVESADQIAERLSQSAAKAVREPVRSEPPRAEKPAGKLEEPKPAVEPAAPPVKRAVEAPASAAPSPASTTAPSSAPSSRAEKELLQALQKLN